MVLHMFFSLSSLLMFSVDSMGANQENVNRSYSLGLNYSPLFEAPRFMYATQFRWHSWSEQTIKRYSTQAEDRTRGERTVFNLECADTWSKIQIRKPCRDANWQSIRLFLKRELQNFCNPGFPIYWVWGVELVSTHRMCSLVSTDVHDGDESVTRRSHFIVSK